MSNMKDKHIAIIGGGPGGLALARILQVHGFTQVKVYERELSRNVRGQGGSLDIHKETGQRCLKDAGLLQAFQKIMRLEGEETKIYDKDGNLLYEEKAEVAKGQRPEVDRGQLRDLLLDSLQEGTVVWDHALARVECLSQQPGVDGHYTLQLVFSNNTLEPVSVDFVIGADGAWSKVRNILTDVKPNYTGISFAEFTCPIKEYPDPEQMTDWIGKGTMFAFEPGQGIVAQMNANNIVRVYAAFQVPEAWADPAGHLDSANIDFTDKQSATQAVLQKFKDHEWHDMFNKLISENTSASVTPRKIHALPINHTWSRKDKPAWTGQVTVLGDAAHVMSPFAGEGVNLALADAADLASELALAVKVNVKFNRAILRFESTMQRRAQFEAWGSDHNLKLIFNKPDDFASMFKSVLFPFNFMARYYMENYFGVKTI